ncbi:MAG TPA: hypothetical protein VM802_22675 [Chitinophaga sp.]|uniref:ComF family protein n=1 Tax=Chitinophaga sp. TaxID=1869181 RepID=UPI002BEE9BA3|nr:ComF family protein [Chitinophaga sp.]HVI47694.1 hypothetical protein [Chitinophaga sp.]
MLIRLLSPVIHLFYPHCCEICGKDLPAADDLLCLRCHDTLPVTQFHRYEGNPVANIFRGRVQIKHAMAAYYYSQSSGMQHLVHSFKYRQRKDIALWLGRQIGYMLQESPWISEIDMLAPVPLFPSKERSRGYNQATLLANGIAHIIKKPVLSKALTRLQFTRTQTRQGRTDRWQNVATVFSADPRVVTGRHILLTDDVITTGATTEACSQALLDAGASVSVCSLAYTTR